MGVTVPMGGVTVPMWGGSASLWGGSPSLWGVLHWPQLWAPGCRGRGAVRLAGLVRGSPQPP